MAILNDLLVKGISRFIGPVTADEIRGLGANYFGTCDTAAATNAKVVTCEGFVLKAGVRISVRFTNGSTSNSTMSLNVNGTGVKNCGIYLYSIGWQTYANRCEKNEILEFMYDGTYWITLTPYALRNFCNYSARFTSANLSYPNLGLQYFLATSTMTVGKPPADSAILNMNWDNNTCYGAQLAVAHSSDAGRLWTRGQLGTTANWTNWLEVPRLSGALTNGQIIVSDESTGTALLKGVSILPTTSIQATAAEIGTIATGDYFLFSDQSDNGKVKASLNFDTTKTTEFLRRDGTWAAPSGGGTVENVTKTFVGTCSTAAATAAKVVTCAEFTAADLVPGTNIYVTFSNTNTTNTAITMNVNNTTAKAVKIISRAGALPANMAAVGYIQKDVQYEFIYDGTYWVMQTFYDADSDSNAYSVREYYTYKKPIANCYQYMILLTSANDTTYRDANYLVPYSGGYLATTYTKTMTTHAFNPFGTIYWLNRSSTNITSTATDGTGHINANANLPAAYVYQMITHGYIDIRYAMDIQSDGTAGTTALTAYLPIYIKAKYDFDTHSATLVPISTSNNYLERSSIVQALPTTNPNSSSDFYIYIHLGMAVDKYRFTLVLDHTVYAWNSITGSMCAFNGSPFSGSGTFTVTDGTSSDTWSYYKIGKQVTVSGKYTGSSTALSLQGLPFTVKFKQVFFLPVQVTSPSMQLYSCQVTLTANATTIGTYGYGTSATSSWLSFAKSAGTQMTFSYITDD